MNRPKRKLKINMIEGEVVMTTGEGRRLLEEIYEDYGDTETGKLDWPTILPELDIPDWQKDFVVVIDQVEAGYGTRYIGIPQVESYEGYNEMVAFIGTVSNPRLRDRLERAVSGRGAFRYFKDVLLDYPEERERWLHFRDERMHRRVLDWLEEEGIEPI